MEEVQAYRTQGALQGKVSSGSQEARAVLQTVGIWTGIIAGLLTIITGVATIIPWTRRYLIRGSHWVTTRRGDRDKEILREIAQLRKQLAERDRHERVLNNVVEQRQQLLHLLTREEQDVLRQYIEKQTRTQNLIRANGVVAGLETNGIIGRPITSTPPGIPCAFNMPLWVYLYLIEHPDLVGLAASSNPATPSQPE